MNADTMCITELVEWLNEKHKVMEEVREVIRRVSAKLCDKQLERKLVMKDIATGYDELERKLVNRKKVEDDENTDNIQTT